MASKAVAYGIPGVGVDGNDVLAVYEAARVAIERARKGEGPTLIEARTYRTVGHHEGDPLVGTYRSQEELDLWKARCPIERFRRQLLASGRVSEADLAAVEASVDQEVEESIDFSRKAPHPDPARAHDHVWAEPLHPDLPGPDPNAETVVQGYLEAVRDAVAEEMRRDPHSIYMGEGTGERGGSFAHTKGLWHEFGGLRMIDTPIAELGFTGAAMGASASGCRAVADLMFVDFAFEAASQIIQQGAKLRYMSNGQLSVPAIVRASWGTVKCTGPHHSGAYHPIWAHCPGLIVVIPSNPADAKGLMKTAYRSSDPVLMLEPKALFASKGPVPKGEYFIPFGVANILRPGTDLTMVSCGTPVHRCVEAAEKLAAEGISCEVIDLRTIVPLDVDTIAQSVAKTGHLLVVDEAFSMCGVGSEIAAAMMEVAFDDLDAPVGRIHTDPTGHPFSPAHEGALIITTERVVEGAKAVLAGKPIIPRRLHGVRSKAAHEARRGSSARFGRSCGAGRVGSRQRHEWSFGQTGHQDRRGRDHAESGSDDHRRQGRRLDQAGRRQSDQGRNRGRDRNRQSGHRHRSPGRRPVGRDRGAGRYRGQVGRDDRHRRAGLNKIGDSKSAMRPSDSSQREV